MCSSAWRAQQPGSNLSLGASAYQRIISYAHDEQGENPGHEKEGSMASSINCDRFLHIGAVQTASAQRTGQLVKSAEPWPEIVSSEAAMTLLRSPRRPGHAEKNSSRAHEVASRGNDIYTASHKNNTFNFCTAR